MLLIIVTQTPRDESQPWQEDVDARFQWGIAQFKQRGFLKVSWPPPFMLLRKGSSTSAVKRIF